VKIGVELISIFIDPHAQNKEEVGVMPHGILSHERLSLSLSLFLYFFRKTHKMLGDQELLEWNLLWQEINCKTSLIASCRTKKVLFAPVNGTKDRCVLKRFKPSVLFDDYMINKQLCC